MKLKSFEIRSYRSCLKTKFPLNEELTSLIGINGAGKSNILNAILLLRKICRTRFNPTQEKETSYNQSNIFVEVSHENKTLYVKGNIVFETDERNYDDVQFSQLKWKINEYFDISDWIELPIEYIGFHESPHLIQSFEYLQYKYRKTPNLFLPKNKTLIPLLSEAFSFFNGINYYSASQFSDPSRCPVSIELEESRPLRKYRQGSGHEHFIFDLYKSFKANDKNYKKYLNAVNDDGIGLIEKIDFTEVDMPSSSYEVKSGGKIRKIERTRHLIVPRFTVNGSELSPNQLSEGTFKTLALIFYVLTDDSKLLLIEEPEVCIHHGLLSSVIELIQTQSRYKQIIISTHSDFVLDHLDPEHLLLVKRAPDKNTIATPLNKSMSYNDYKALRLYLQETGNLGDYWREGGFKND